MCFKRRLRPFACSYDDLLALDAGRIAGRKDSVDVCVIVLVDQDLVLLVLRHQIPEEPRIRYTPDLKEEPLHVESRLPPGLAIANRDGNANTATGSRRMLSTIVARLRNHLDIGYSVGVRRTSRMWDLINTIDDDRWVPIDYRSGVAQVAQTWDNKWGRIIVRRVRNIRDGALFDTWEHHAFVTSNSAPVVEADAHHRDHAVVELNIRDLKAGALAHVPSGARHANAAWVICAGIAYNIARWATNFDTAGFPIRRRTTIATIRQFFIAIAVRVCRPQGKPRISGPLDWPAAELIQACNRSIALMPHWSG